MIKNKLAVLLMLLMPCVGNAGLISHTDYSAGSVISAAGQNTNENTIFNEFNGNIDNNNIKTSGIVNANISAGVITVDKFATSLTSTFTYLANTASYSRPHLVYVDGTHVQISSNSSTAGTTCVAFPDDYRCSASTTYTQLNTAQSCLFTGSEQSGLSGAALATNTWYGVYAVKSNVSASNFVTCASTNTPSTANASALDGMYGHNGWTYLGLVRNGDQSGSTNVILKFRQSGNMTMLSNGMSGNTATGQTLLQRGMLIAGNNGSANTSTFTYTTGTSGAVYTPNIGNVYIQAAFNKIANGHMVTVYDQSATISIASMPDTGVSVAYTMQFWEAASFGVAMHNDTYNNMAQDICLTGWTDDALAVGASPQL